jgi:hypothetical protein
MFEKENSDSIEFAFNLMLNSNQLKDFLSELKISLRGIRKSPKASFIEDLKKSKDFTITLEQLRNFLREKWLPYPIDNHLKHLKSGLLKGQSWHNAMPSFLHRSLQDKVRECASGKYDLNELIKIGGDIMKKEYFIVATHDICESKIILDIEEILPSLTNKGVADFMFRGIPFDLKVSQPVGKWNFETAQKRNKEFAKSMFVGGDVERIRKQANSSINGWGQNRLYVLTKDDKLWIANPELLLKKIVDKIKQLGEPLEIDIGDGARILCHLIFID